MARDVCEVTRKIQELVPIYEIGFHKSLEDHISTFSYRPPELQGLCWKELQETIIHFISPTKMPNVWEILVLSEFSTVPIDVIERESKRQIEAMNS